MKIIISVFLLIYFSDASAQKLKNTEWTQITAERKDGSKILDRLHPEQYTIKYIFSDKSVITFLNSKYQSETGYTVTGKTLSIGDYIKYTIDTADSEILMLTQISNSGLTDDKINRFIFLSRRSIYQYLKENDLVENDDSFLVSNNKFAPSFNGNIDSFLLSKFGIHKINSKLFGYFIINDSGKILDVHFYENTVFLDNEIKKLTDIIKLTDRFWSLPETPKNISIKVNFLIDFSKYSEIKFSLIDKSFDQDSIKTLTITETIKSNDYFKEGNEFFQKGNYAKASKLYIKCVEIDSFFLDAYYNLGYCYQKLNKKDMACEIWSKLKNMGQKEGENLYNNDCK